MGFIHDLIDVVWALRWVITFAVIALLGALLADSNTKRHELEDIVIALDTENEFIHRRLRLAQNVDSEKVLDFISGRPELLGLAQNAVLASDLGGRDPKYNFYAGQAAARRELATALRLTVPTFAGDRPEPSTSYARVVNG
jgi:hypothetical protein